MRPLKLHLQYFGPYKDEVIDFQKLTGTTVFLVSGNTGSGKTTIFDAMCYALFGQTTNDQDRDAAALRSDFAPNNQETRVTFTFIHKGQTYQITRQPKQTIMGRGNKLVEHGTKVSLIYPLENPEPNEISKIGPANQFIEQLLNLTRDQFKQIVLLPQGKFRQFLESSSSDKETLLRDLFNTHFYEQWAATLKNQLTEQQQTYKQTLDKLSVTKANLADVNGDQSTAEWLSQVEEQIKDRQSDIENISQEITRQQLVTNQLNQQLTNQHALVQAMDEKKEADADLLNLQEQAPQINQWRQIIERLTWYQEHQAEYLNYQSLRTKLAENQQLITDKQAEIRKLCIDQKKVDTVVEQLKQRSETIQKLQERKNVLENQLPQYMRRDQLKQAVQTGDKQVNEQRQLVASQKSKLELTQQRLQKVTDELDQLNDVHDHELNFETQRHQLQKLQEIVADIQSHQRKSNELSKQQQSLQKWLDQQQQLIGQAQTTYDDLKDAYARGEIARLVHQLKPGSPCPVCGATDHPHPAPLPKGDRVVLNDEVEAANQRLNQLQREQAAKKSQFDDQKHQVNEEMATINELLVQLSKLMNVDLKTIDGATEKVRDFSETVNKLRQDLINEKRQTQELLIAQSDLKQRQTEEQQQFTEGQKELDELQMQLTTDRATYQAVADDLQTEYADAKSAKTQVDEWQAQIDQFQQHQQKVQRKQAMLSERVTNNQQELTRLNQLVQTLQKQVTESHKKLQQQLVDYSPELDDSFWPWAGEHLNELTTLQSRLQDYQTKQTRLQALIQRLNKQIGTQSRPDVEQTSQELAEEQRRLAELQRRSGQLSSELQNIVKIHDQVVKINRQQNSELKRVQDLQTVSDVMNGNTDNKLSLERYVLQSYLTEVLQVANERLAKLTNGRYAFKLSDEAVRGNGTKWSGLEINVYDDNAGQERSVRTLSGGESFIASLALALGLGEVIQERSGGIKVETLFIDEGFGSLDQEALEQAMNALQSIKGYQMIGIISHVTELENQIPNQLRVISRNGVSHVEYRQEISSLEN